MVTAAKLISSTFIDFIEFEADYHHKALGTLLPNVRGNDTHWAADQKIKIKAYAADTAICRSLDIDEQGYAARIRVKCCPARALQTHNIVFPHGIKDTVRLLLVGVIKATGGRATSEEKQRWQAGEIEVREVDITGYHRAHRSHVEPMLELFRANNLDHCESQMKSPTHLRLQAGWPI